MVCRPVGIKKQASNKTTNFKPIFLRIAIAQFLVRLRIFVKSHFTFKQKYLVIFKLCYMNCERLARISNLNTFMQISSQLHFDLREIMTLCSQQKLPRHSIGRCSAEVMNINDFKT